MKQKDVALILVVVFVSGIISFIVSDKLFAPSASSQKVEVVDAIDPTFTTPDAAYFNSNSINPTQLITIGNSSNPNPFNAQ